MCIFIPLPLALAFPLAGSVCEITVNNEFEVRGITFDKEKGGIFV